MCLILQHSSIVSFEDLSISWQFNSRSNWWTGGNFPADDRVNIELCFAGSSELIQKLRRLQRQRRLWGRLRNPVFVGNSWLTPLEHECVSRVFSLYRISLSSSLSVCWVYIVSQGNLRSNPHSNYRGQQPQLDKDGWGSILYLLLSTSRCEFVHRNQLNEAPTWKNFNQYFGVLRYRLPKSVKWRHSFLYFCPPTIFIWAWFTGFRSWNHHHKFSWTGSQRGTKFPVLFHYTSLISVQYNTLKLKINWREY